MRYFKEPSLIQGGQLNFQKVCESMITLILAVQNVVSLCLCKERHGISNVFTLKFSLVEKVAVSIYDIEEATAKSMDIIVADKVSSV